MNPCQNGQIFCYHYFHYVRIAVQCSSFYFNFPR